MSKQTHTVSLSKQEVAQLRESPYVAAVTESTVRFTEKFKEIVFNAKKQGVSVAKTMREHGIDPEILGESRVRGFSHTLNRRAKQDTGLSDRRKENYRRPPKTGEETLEQRIVQVEHELAYTRQEVEFLKKLQVANTEARKQWESKQRQK